MFCKACGAENYDDAAKFCAKCGTDIETHTQAVARTKTSGGFHRFSVASLIIWTAFWAGLTFSTMALVGDSAGKSAGAMIGVGLGLGIYAFFWFLPSLVLGILAIATKPSPSVAWPRSTKLATGILAVLVFLWPFALHSVGSSSSTSGPVANSDGGSDRPPGGKSKWAVSAGTSEMDGSPLVSLSLDAQNEVQGWLAAERPTLFIRCKERQTNLFIRVGMSASVESGNYDQHTVRIRLDGNPPMTQLWSESTDGKALFAGAPQKLAKKIAQSKVMLFEFTPFQGSPATARFDVGDLDKLLDKVSAPCGWKPE